MKKEKGLTQALKTKNKSVYQKPALQIAKNRITKDRKAKEQALAEKS